MVEHLPLPVPEVPADFKPSDLTLDEQEKQQKVLAYFADPAYKISGLEEGSLTEDEKFWLSHECILRYLRATTWNTDATLQRIEETLKWRREFGLYDVVTAELVEPEADTGSRILFGYDKSRRPAFNMIPSRQTTDNGTRQIQCTVWMLERAIEQMGPGVENIAILADFCSNVTVPPVWVARTIISILQNHYPERLGLALGLNIPWLVNAFLKVLMPFVDPVTRSKIKLNPEVVKDGLFTPDQVMKEWSGDGLEFAYDHEKYWPELIRTCGERRKMQMEKWRELGAKVGLKEWDVRGGQTKEAENGRAEKTIGQTKDVNA